MMPILVPVSVPWRIELACPMLHLEAFEIAGEPPVSVSMWVDCITTASDSIREQSSPIGLDWRIARIKISFTNAIWPRMCEAFSDGEVIPEANYDWSRIPIRLGTDEDHDAYLTRYHNWCIEHGRCPDPRMYEVVNSEWREALPPILASAGYRHFIMLGHDAYVEVVAKNWSWEECPGVTPPG